MGKRQAQSDPTTPEQVSKIANSAFFRIMELWSVSPDQARVLLGNPALSSFFAWKTGHGGMLSKDTLERIGYVLGIYKALQVLYPDTALADGWITRGMDVFGGQSPLQRMLGGDVSDLYEVRRYLDYVRGSNSSVSSG